MCVSGYAQRQGKGIRSYGAVVKDRCELPGMGAGHQTPVLKIQYEQSFL